VTKHRNLFLKKSEREYSITTQAELRRVFWESNPEFQRKGNQGQNAYNATIRSAWCFFVDAMQKDGQISHALAKRAGL
jgi:hypothetical protein